MIGLLMGMGALPASAESAAGIVELLLVLSALAGAVIFAVVTKPKESVEPKETPAPLSQS